MKPRYEIERVRGLAEHELPASMCREIGRIVVRWSYLELTAQAMVRQVMKISEAQARIALREPRLSDRLMIIRDLIALLDGEWNEELFKSVLKRANDLKVFRDMVAHGTWANRYDGWYVERARGAWESDKASLVEAKNRVVMPELVPMGLQRLQEISNNIKHLIEDMRSLRDSAHQSSPNPAF